MKYRRLFLIGKCLKCGGKIVFIVSKGVIEKYLFMVKMFVIKYRVKDYMR